MMTGIDYLVFDGNKYPCCEIFYDNNWNIVATTELSEKLFDNEAGNWVSEEARIIDEKIIFFIEPEQIYLPIKELIKILRHNIQ